MKFSYQWLKEYVHPLPAPKALAEFVTLRAFEVESAEKAGDDTVFDITLPPNRVSDAGGHIGMAREIAALYRRSLKERAVRVPEDRTYPLKRYLSASVDDPEGCRRYCARIMSGITVRSSPEWLIKRLNACGIRPISNVVDATNYIMLETGQPVHVYDYDAIEGKTLTVRRVRAGETIRTLGEKDLTLAKDDLVVADAARALALAGIQGGDAAEVSVETTTLVLEAASFDGARIRRTSRRLGVRTEASYRFEHDLHPDLAAYALERLAALLADVTGGKAYAGSIDIYPGKKKTPWIRYRPARAEMIVGCAFPARAHKDALERIGCKARAMRGGYAVTPPRFRRDCVIEEDLVEEVIRNVGYDHIKEAIPPVFSPPEENVTREWSRLVRQTFRTQGFTELYRYAFVGSHGISRIGGSESEYIAIEHPVSPELRYLVREPYESLIPFIRSELPREKILRVFSLDKGFIRIGNGEERDVSAFVREERYLTVVYASAERATGGPEDFYRIKGVLGEVCDEMGVGEMWFDEALAPREEYPKLAVLSRMHPYRRAEIKIGDETIGVAGELHPQMMAELGIGGRVYLAEVFTEPLFARASGDIVFREIPRFPAIERDLSLLVPAYTRIEEVQGMLENAGGALLEDVDFIDEYTGEGIPDGRRSMTFRLVFRDRARTLREQDVAEHMKALLAMISEKAWEVR